MFSVVIPLYNKSYGIVRAIESILNQDLNIEYEIIVINDGSTDDSVDKLKKYLNHPNISLINQKNSGVSIARNAGIKRSKFDYICFLDADDWWNDNYFSTLYNLIKMYPNEVFFLMGYSKIYSHTSKDVQISSKLEVFKNFGKKFWNTRGLVTPSICVKKEILFMEGLFPNGVTLTEDLHLWSKIICKHYVVYDPTIVSNIFYEEDNSRKGRAQIVPYTLEYYALNKNLIKKLRPFLKYIYLAHIYQSYKTEDYESWKKRWYIGLKIFPFFSFPFIIMGFFLKLKKNLS